VLELYCHGWKDSDTDNEVVNTDNNSGCEHVGAQGQALNFLQFLDDSAYSVKFTADRDVASHL